MVLFRQKSRKKRKKMTQSRRKEKKVWLNAVLAKAGGREVSIIYKLFDLFRASGDK